MTPRPPEVNSPGAGTRLGLVGRALLGTTLVFLLLEIWRPCFFLTDDNLTAGLPFLSGMGRRILHGQSPYICDFLFGGGYNALRDPNYFCWHPLYFAVSLLGSTPARFWLIDAAAYVLLLLTAAGFANLVWFLRRELALGISDGWALFFTLSYTFTFMALTAGASWLDFLANHSALPWLALGLFQRRLWHGAGLIALFLVHAILGGHFAPLIATTLFFTLFSLGIAWWRRSPVPVLSWGLGYVIAVAVVSPLLYQAISGFMVTSRSGGLSADEMQVSRIPLVFFPGSYLAGTAAWLVKRPADFHVYHPALAACAAAWCLFPALLRRARWHVLEILCAAMLVAGAFLIIRPLWVSEIMRHLPLLRSLRDPFRELLEFHFFLHLLLVLRTPAFGESVRRAIAAWSTLVFVVPLVLYAPPSFNPMAQQRALLFSGDFDRYWAQVRGHLSATDRILAVVPVDAVHIAGEWAPYCLLGGHDFAGLAGVVNASGYSPTAPADQLYLQTKPYVATGYFVSSQIDALWRERPNLKLIVMESVSPVRISLRSSDGTSVDLTPYLPPGFQLAPQVEEINHVVR